MAEVSAEALRSAVRVFSEAFVAGAAGHAGWAASLAAPSAGWETSRKQSGYRPVALRVYLSSKHPRIPAHL